MSCAGAWLEGLSGLEFQLAMRHLPGLGEPVNEEPETGQQIERDDQEQETAEKVEELVHEVLRCRRMGPECRVGRTTGRGERSRLVYCLTDSN